MSSLRNLFVLLLSILVLTSCQSTQSRFSDADEALYAERYKNLMESFRTKGKPAPYDNLEPVAGTDNYTSLKKSLPVVTPESILAAREYARVNNSIAFIIWHDGQIIEETYFGDANQDTPVTSLSLAKPLSVIAVGRAIHEGYIDSLNISIADYITEWQGTDKSKIELEHILRMSSGLLPQAQATTPEDVLNRAYLHPRHDEVIFHEYPLVDEPGSIYEYSNANGELVAPVLARATGKSYGDWISESVLKPLGAKGGEVFVNRPGGTAHSGCCILLPADTYFRLALLVLNDGVWEGERLLPEGYVKKMSTHSTTNEQVGMGLYMGQKYIERRGFANPEKIPEKFKTYHSEPYLADDLVLFDGNQNQVAFIIPSEKLVILRVGERPLSEPEWDNSFLPNTILRGLRN